MGTRPFKDSWTYLPIWDLDSEDRMTWLDLTLDGRWQGIYCMSQAVKPMGKTHTMGGDGGPAKNETVWCALWPPCFSIASWDRSFGLPIPNQLRCKGHRSSMRGQFCQLDNYLYWWSILLSQISFAHLLKFRLRTLISSITVSVCNVGVNRDDTQDITYCKGYILLSSLLVLLFPD